VKNRYLMTAIGKDKPGIVKSVAEVLYKVGCNIEDSSMTLLAGNFAIMMVIYLPGDIDIEELEEKFEKLRKKMNLWIILKPMSETPAKKKTKKQARNCLLTLSGGDKPGIVYSVSKLLSGNKVNIININTRIIGDGEDSSYILVMELELPIDLQYVNLKNKLLTLADKLDVEINLEPMEFGII